jgi:hypothetical protein
MIGSRRRYLEANPAFQSTTLARRHHSRSRSSRYGGDHTGQLCG